MRKKLKWYVMVEDSGSHKLNYLNALSYIEEPITKRLDEGKVFSREELKDLVTDLLKRNFLSKDEFELLVSGLHSREEYLYTIDPWYQLKPNIDAIVDYIVQTLEIELRQ